MQGLAAPCQRAREEAVGQGAQPLSIAELHNPQRRADIGYVIFDGQRKHLRIGQSGKEFFQLSRPMMKNAVLQGADPEIAVIAGEGRDVGRLEARVEGREPPAVEYQDSLAFRAEQDPPRTQIGRASCRERV